MQFRHRPAVALISLLFAVASLSASAQDDPGKILVYVESTCDRDTVGQRLAYQTKEQIRRSSQLAVTDNYTSSSLQFKMVCLDPPEGQAGVVSSYSYVITALNTGGHFDFLISSIVASCGANRVSHCAESHLADIDQAVTSVRKRIADGTFQYKASE